MAELPAKKEDKISVRVPPELKARIRAAYDNYRVAESDLVIDAVKAALDYIDVNRGFPQPIIVAFDKETAELNRSLAAEDPKKKKKP